MKAFLFIFLFSGTALFASAQFISSPYQGANFLSKNLNNALDFDGLNDCVITTLDVNRSAIPITTWEAWVYPTATDATWRTIFGIEDGSWDRNVFINGGRFWAGHGCDGWNITDINLNEWQHIAIVYDEVNSRIVFYKNGVAFTKTNNICLPVSAVKFAIGSSQQSGPNQFFQGKISDVRVWNLERTQAQIQANMNIELTGEESGLVSYYPFKQALPNDVNTGSTTLFDEVGSYNGAINNFTLTGLASNFTFGKIQSRIPRNNLVMHVNPAMKRSYSGSGNSLVDLTGNGNNMTLYNSPTYISSYGGVFSLNGTTQYIESVNNAPITGTNKRTVGMWVYPRTFTSYTPNSIFSTGTSASNTGMFGIFANGDGTNNLSFWGHYSDYYSGIKLNLNDWNFLAVTYNGNGLLKVHANGVTETVSKNVNTVANQINLFLKTNGNFGEMMIYDRELSHSDLVYLFERTKSKYPLPDGLTAATAAINAKAIKAAYPSVTDGVYWIDLPTVGPKQIYCLMDSKYDGGGWMMAMKASSTNTTFSYDANYWYTNNTLSVAEFNRNSGDAKFETMNYFASKDILALWPDIPNVSAESGSIDNLTNWSWLQNNFHNTGSTTTLIAKFAATPTQAAIENNTTGTITFSGYGTPFSKQGGYMFYGFNYQGNASHKVRWGVAWNNEADQATNDVSVGIGLAARSYSAGDAYGCCGTFAGIDRSARVELYIR
jgi:hypothetical protein